MSLGVIIGICGVVFGLGGFFATYFGFVLKLMGEDKETNSKVAATNERVSKVEGSMVLCSEHTRSLEAVAADTKDMNHKIDALVEQSKMYWEVLAPMFRDRIHSPEHKTRDDLVDLLVADKIVTLRDARLLQKELEALLEEEEDPMDRFGAALFLGRTRWVLCRLERRQARRHENRQPKGGAPCQTGLKTS